MNETQIRLFNQSKICFQKLQYLSSIHDCFYKNINLRILRTDMYKFICIKLNDVNDLCNYSKTLDTSIFLFDLFVKEILEEFELKNLNNSNCFNINHYKKYLLDASQVCMIMAIKLFESHPFDIIKCHFNLTYNNNKVFKDSISIAKG